MNHEVKRATEILPHRLQALKRLMPVAKEALNNGKISLSAMQECSESMEKQGQKAVCDIKAYFDKLRSILTKREEALMHGVTEQVEMGQKKLEQNTLALGDSLENVCECMQELEQVVNSRNVDILLKDQQLKSRLLLEQQNLETFCNTATTLTTLSIKPPPLEDKRLEVLCGTLAARAPSPLPRKRQEHLTPSIQISKADSECDYYAVPPGSEHRNFSEEPENKSDCIYEVVCPPSPKPPLRKESYFCDSPIVEPELVWWSSKLRNAFPNSPAGKSVYPRGVCCSTGGTVIVTDVQNHCLQMLTPTGECVHVLGREGHGNGQFIEPTSVTTDQWGHILVCDLSPARVQKFSSDGTFSLFQFR